MIGKLVRFFIRESSIFLNTLLFKTYLVFSGNKIPNHLKIDGFVHLKISDKGVLDIGENFYLNSRKASNLVGITNKAIFQIIDEGKIIIGNNCGFTSTVLSSRSLIQIGNQVKIGGNVRIFDHDYHSLNHLLRQNKESDTINCKTKPVIIENDVFIGTNSIILKGVHIGARTIIGAGSVVTIKEIPADSIVVGNPAIIKKRG